jgi:hypothetical protein
MKPGILLYLLLSKNKAFPQEEKGFQKTIQNQPRISD